MTTIRTPLHRRFRPQITKRVLAIFRRMLEIECTCADGSHDQCPGCDEYHRLDWELHAEMKLNIWEGPALWWPHWQPHHPPQTGAGEWQRGGGPELFRLLEDAACFAEFNFSKTEKLVTAAK